MAVSTEAVVATYAGDGSTVAFPYPNYLYEAGDLVVATTLGGVVTTYTLNATGAGGFTFAGVADAFGAYPSGGTVTFNAAPAGGGTVVTISRDTPENQNFTPTDPMTATGTATNVEHAYDKLTLMVQELEQQIAAIATPAPAPIKINALKFLGTASIPAGAGSSITFIEASETAAGDTILTLPASTGSLGIYVVKKKTAAGSRIGVAPTGADKIDNVNATDYIGALNAVNIYIDFQAGDWNKW
jgi:hypothetical protein